MPSPPAKMKLLLILEESSWKQKLNFSLCTLFHTKTRVSPKYFVSSCRLIRISRIQCWCSFYSFFIQWRCLFYSFILLFLDKPGPKNENYQFRLNFPTFTNSNMQNSLALLTFSVLDQKHPFWANVVQKTKIVSLNWNLVPRLIWISRMWWWSSLFLFYTRNTLFGKRR